MVASFPLTEEKHLRTVPVGSHGVTTIFQKAPVNMDKNEMWRMWFMSKSLYTILCCPYSIYLHAHTHAHLHVLAHVISNIPSSVCLKLWVCAGYFAGV